MNKKTPLTELDNRMKQFKKRMDTVNPEWNIVVIFSKINIYYFTGTMQDGILIIRRDDDDDDDDVFLVRRSYERALDESLFRIIKNMNSFRDAAGIQTRFPDTVYLETNVVPLALYQRFNKHFQFKNFKFINHFFLDYKNSNKILSYKIILK